jgi:UDP-2,3-diacylglucosamine pyrophosphatase LpxH
MENKNKRPDYNFEQIIGWGDMHKHHQFIEDYINNHQITNTLFLQVGDFGIGFKFQKSNQALEKLQNFMAKTHNHLWVVRGNHDDPSFFQGQHQWSHLRLLTDYYYCQINGRGFLFIGGAVSIDRKSRRGYLTGLGEGDWWFEEEVFYNPLIKDLKGINVVVSHTAPPCALLPHIANMDKQFFQLEVLIREDVLKEKAVMTQIYEELKVNNSLETWLFGHFHHSYQKQIADTNFIQLGIQEPYPLN